MATVRSPHVFVSSTCYDLAQIRVDLRDFLLTLGSVPILSELDTFPVDPVLDTVSNSLSAVRENADILVLIVGGRYGWQTEAGKSVTNLEYLEAKAKGIPIYVFVQRSILTSLPIWKKNPGGDFSDVVDSNKVFEFVESLSGFGRVWRFPFDTAQDIIATLRIQVSYLFMDALTIRAKVMQTRLFESETLRSLSSASLQLAVQRPFGWGNRLFVQVLSDELAQCRTLKRDVEYGLALGRGVRLGDKASVREWLAQKNGEIIAFLSSAEAIVNTALAEALSASGNADDVEHVVYVAKRVAQMYRRLLEWTSDFKHVQVPTGFERLIELGSHLAADMIIQIEEFAHTLQTRTEEAVKKFEETREQQIIEITLRPAIRGMPEFLAEFDRVCAA